MTGKMSLVILQSWSDGPPKVRAIAPPDDDRSVIIEPDHQGRFLTAEISQDDPRFNARQRAASVGAKTYRSQQMQGNDHHSIANGNGSTSSRDKSPSVKSFNSSIGGTESLSENGGGSERKPLPLFLRRRNGHLERNSANRHSYGGLSDTNGSGGGEGVVLGSGRFDHDEDDELEGVRGNAFTSGRAKFSPMVGRSASSLNLSQRKPPPDSLALRPGSACSPDHPEGSSLECTPPSSPVPGGGRYRNLGPELAATIPKRTIKSSWISGIKSRWLKNINATTHPEDDYSGRLKSYSSSPSLVNSSTSFSSSALVQEVGSFSARERQLLDLEHPINPEINYTRSNSISGPRDIPFFNPLYQFNQSNHQAKNNNKLKYTRRSNTSPLGLSSNSNSQVAGPYGLELSLNHDSKATEGLTREGDIDRNNPKTNNTNYKRYTSNTPTSTGSSSGIALSADEDSVSERSRSSLSNPSYSPSPPPLSKPNRVPCPGGVVSLLTEGSTGASIGSGSGPGNLVNLRQKIVSNSSRPNAKLQKYNSLTDFSEEFTEEDLYSCNSGGSGGSNSRSGSPYYSSNTLPGGVRGLIESHSNQHYQYSKNNGASTTTNNQADPSADEVVLVEVIRKAEGGKVQAKNSTKYSNSSKTYGGFLPEKKRHSVGEGSVEDLDPVLCNKFAGVRVEGSPGKVARIKESIKKFGRFGRNHSEKTFRFSHPEDLVNDKENKGNDFGDKEREDLAKEVVAGSGQLSSSSAIKDKQEIFTETGKSLQETGKSLQELGKAAERHPPKPIARKRSKVLAEEKLIESVGSSIKGDSGLGKSLLSDESKSGLDTSSSSSSSTQDFKGKSSESDQKIGNKSTSKGNKEPGEYHLSKQGYKEVENANLEKSNKQLGVVVDPAVAAVLILKNGENDHEEEPPSSIIGDQDRSISSQINSVPTIDIQSCLETSTPITVEDASLTPQVQSELELQTSTFDKVTSGHKIGPSSDITQKSKETDPVVDQNEADVAILLLKDLLTREEQLTSNSGLGSNSRRDILPKDSEMLRKIPGIMNGSSSGSSHGQIPFTSGIVSNAKSHLLSHNMNGQGINHNPGGQLNNSHNGIILGAYNPHVKLPPQIILASMTNSNSHSNNRSSSSNSNNSNAHSPFSTSFTPEEEAEDDVEDDDDKVENATVVSNNKGRNIRHGKYSKQSNGVASVHVPVQAINRHVSGFNNHLSGHNEQQGNKYNSNSKGKGSSDRSSTNASNFVRNANTKTNHTKYANSVEDDPRSGSAASSESRSDSDWQRSSTRASFRGFCEGLLQEDEKLLTIQVPEVGEASINFENEDDSNSNSGSSGTSRSGSLLDPDADEERENSVEYISIADVKVNHQRKVETEKGQSQRDPLPGCVISLDIGSRGSGYSYWIREQPDCVRIGVVDSGSSCPRSHKAPSWVSSVDDLYLDVEDDEDNDNANNPSSPGFGHQALNKFLSDDTHSHLISKWRECFNEGSAYPYTLESKPGDDELQLIIKSAIRHYGRLALEQVDQKKRGGPSGRMIMVVAIPSSFDRRARQLVRDAAFGSGLVTQKDGFALIEDPCAAGIYAYHAIKSKLLGNKSDSKGLCFLSVDIGGTYLHSSGYEIMDGKLRLVLSPRSQVILDSPEALFALELSSIFTPPFIFNYQNKYKGGWLKLLTEFERSKNLYDASQRGNYYIFVPSSFVEHFKRFTNMEIEDALEPSDILWNKVGAFGIPYWKMTRFVQPHIEFAKDFILSLVKNHNYDHLVLTGGRAGSRHLVDCIKNGLRDFSVQIFVPKEYNAAVLQGSSISLTNLSPRLIIKSPFSIGVGVMTPFLEDQHPEEKRVLRDGKSWCADVWDSLIKFGQDLELNRVVLKRSYVGAQPGQSLLILPLFKSPNEPKFVTESTVEKCCEFKFNSGQRAWQEVELVIKCRPSELLITALDGGVMKNVVVVDFA